MLFLDEAVEEGSHAEDEGLFLLPEEDQVPSDFDRDLALIHREWEGLDKLREFLGSFVLRLKGLGLLACVQFIYSHRISNRPEYSRKQ